MQVSEFKSNGQKALPIKHSKDNVSKSFTLVPSLKYVTEIRITFIIHDRGVTGGRAGWAIAHPVFGRIEGAASQWRHTALCCITNCPPSKYLVASYAPVHNVLDKFFLLYIILLPPCSKGSSGI